MKAHIGVDSKTGLVHSLIATSANVHDSQALPDLLHGNETRVWGDSAYMGQKAAIEKRAPNAKDFTNKRARRNRPLTEEEHAANRTKSRVRAKVEHPFCVVKRLWGFAKVRYRGLAKNANRLYVAFALSNLFVSRNKLLHSQRA
jgi:IS5 family transposase